MIGGCLETFLTVVSEGVIIAVKVNRTSPDMVFQNLGSNSSSHCNRSSDEDKTAVKVSVAEFLRNVARGSL